jgi:hypothetical protein
MRDNTRERLARLAKQVPNALASLIRVAASYRIRPSTKMALALIGLQFEVERLISRITNRSPGSLIGTF